MHYQIFLPDTNDGQAVRRLEAVGLADHIGGADLHYIDAGPGDRPGTLCVWRSPEHQADLCYAPQRQTWLAAVPAGQLEAGRYFVGFNDADPPRPSELMRPYPYRGHFCQLGRENQAGSQWLIPAASELPREMILADDGSWKYEIQRRHYRYSLDVEHWKTKLGGADDSIISMDEVADFALAALRLNYRITKEVVSHLRLFTTKNVGSPLLAACDCYVQMGRALEG